jgi:hypothetical protein
MRAISAAFVFVEQHATVVHSVPIAKCRVAKVLKNSVEERDQRARQGLQMKLRRGVAAQLKSCCASPNFRGGAEA